MSAGPARRLAAGESLRALFVKMPATAEVELAGHVGFDAVILDTEHGAASASWLEHHLRAADAARVPALVRVPGADPAAILAALDGGAHGVVVPHVSDPQTAAAVVAAARYPPRGHRGLALTTRAGRYGRASLSEHLARADAETLVVVQIEDREAVAQARQILSVDGVDAVLIGATDLSISLGHPGAPEHPDVAAAIETILRDAAATGTIAATVLADPAAATESERRGIRLSVFVDAQLVGAAFAHAASAGRGAEAASAAGASPRAPLVLLPGMLGSAELWEPVATALAVDHGLVVRHARIDLDDTVAEMAGTVLATAPARFSLVGHSLGAIVALEVVRRAPSRVTRLALLNASARPASEAQLTAWGAQRERLAAGELGALVDEFALTNAPGGSPELLATLRAMAGVIGGRGFDRQLRAQASRPDARPGLAAIGCPTCVVSGEEDRVCPPALQEELAAGIPDARLVRIPGSGHVTPLQAPAAVVAALAEWAA